MKTVSKKLLSLLLVAILLVSALPFQAFATDIEGMPEGGSENTALDTTTAGDPAAPADGGTEAPQEDPPAESKIPHTADHLAEVWSSDAAGHWQVCHVAGCELEGQEVARNTHSFDANGVCTVCKYACPHTNQGPKADTAVAATCVKPGKEADTVCMDCGAVLAKGTEISATGKHNYVNGVCKECGATETGATFKLTFDANGGTIGGMSMSLLEVKQGAAIGTLPVPSKAGCTFAGWYIGNDYIEAGTIYTLGADATAVAKWTEVTYQLTVRRVLNGNNATAKTIKTVNVPAGTPLLAYLNENVAGDIRADLNLTPGYEWQNNYWRDYSGTQALTDQTATMNQAQTVFVNFVSKSYNLYFTVGAGASVSPTSKTVYFGSAVGALPVPTASGKVFSGWKDSNGNFYDSSTIYKVAGDTTLTAVWKDEAMVILYIYVNGNFSACDRMVVIDKLVNNDNISRSAVYSEVVKHYTPASGVLSIAGLFDEYTWSSYKANTSKPGTENIQIDDSRVNRIYVMVNNANTGTILPPTNPTYPTVPSNGFWVRDLNGNLTWYPAGSSLPSGYGYWTYDANGNPIIWVMTGNYFPTYPNNSNPKTGDTAQIEMAAAVMVLAAAALITVMALRKKKHA